MNTWRYFLHALSPLHVGTGQGEGLIDLPIVRDPASKHPLVPGSSTKGVLRDAAKSAGTADLTHIFGPDTNKAHEHAGALRVSDARLLLLPVHSDLGTFAWLSSPWALARLLRDVDGAPDFDIPKVAAGQAHVAAGSALGEAQKPVAIGGQELGAGPALDGKLVDTLATWVFGEDAWWRDALRQRIAVVDDDTFTFFARHRTDVRAHIRIGDSGTVDKGGLWYEESLPAETVLSGFLQSAPNGKATAQRVGEFVTGLSDTRLQFGANATTGMGLCRFLVRGGR